MQWAVMGATEIHLLVRYQGCPPQLSHPGSRDLCSSGALRLQEMELGCATWPRPRDVPCFKCRITKLFIKKSFKKGSCLDELPARS